jgi:transglutaminase-like putative cysteine protease
VFLRIQHETRLTYTAPVSETVFEVRMAPASNEDETTLGYRLHVSPPRPLTPYRDGFGNRVDLFNILAPCREVVVRATSYVQTHRRPGLARLAEVPWPATAPVALEALEFLRPSPLVNRCPALDEFVANLPSPPATLGGFVEQLLTAVKGRLRYEKKVTTANTPVSDALELGRGVCQDYAHLFLGACRACGLPARYVSGYVNHPGEIATHAWCQVWGGDPAGWVDLDPTQGHFVDAHHVLVAVGRDYADVPPNRGVWKGDAEETIAVAVKVEPLERMPPDWSEMGNPVGWTGMAYAQTQDGRRQVQRQGTGTARTLYRHQQSQQQQSKSGRISRGFGSLEAPVRIG